MKAVIQRVSQAAVSINGDEYSRIDQGYLVLLGIEKGDNDTNASVLAKKIIDVRIFEDNNGKMNLGLRDIEGDVLVISQFTLCTDNTKSGNRPSFTLAEEPAEANRTYEFIVDEMKNYYDAVRIKTGIFAAEMKVSLTNEGPVTIILER